MGRRSKYPDIGIMAALERLTFGGVPKFTRTAIYNEASKNKQLTRGLFSKKVYALKQNGFIEYLNDQEFILTPKGLRKINFAKLDKLSLGKKKEDGLWRLIIFDVPELKRGARELLRGKLLEFNCYQLQKSVYVTPYVCEKEIEELGKILGVENYVDVIVAKSLGQKEDQVGRYFSKF